MNKLGKCLYKLDNRSYETTLFCDNVGLVFDIGYKFTRMVSNLIPDSSYRFVDIISVLQGPTGVEVAYNINGSFAKFTSTKSAITLSDILTTQLKPMFIGTRPIRVGNASAIQYVYAYNLRYLNAQALEPNLK